MESAARNQPVPTELPILPIRNRVLFPGSYLRLSIGRQSTVNLIKQTIYKSPKDFRKKSIYLGIFTLAPNEEKKDSIPTNVENGQEKIHHSIERLIDSSHPELFATGTVARVVQLSQAANSKQYQFSVLVQGIKRIRISSFLQEHPFFMANVIVCATPYDTINFTSEVKRLAIRLREVTRELLNLPGLKKEQSSILAKTRELFDAIATSSPGDLAFLLISSLEVEVEVKQRILHADLLTERLELTIQVIEDQIELLKLTKKINGQVKDRLNDTRKEYYLRQQLQAIKEELGENETEDENELESMEEKLKAHDMSEETRSVAMKELRRLKKLPAAQPEHHVVRSYLEWILELPWKKCAEDHIDLEALSAQLDKDHYGLDHVKRRIREYMAVCKLRSSIKGPILCLVGPPGVGKTSLGKSIAKATNRPFERVALGGVHDEAEIRGHRRTYIGAMPGSIIHSIKRAGVSNPVLLLDEVDKVGVNSRNGDVSSALLEVLDPAQNSTFSDHYLNTPYDLSKVLFIATANSIDTIPAPLLDRMEVIDVNGYIIDEKLKIAEQFLLPKQLTENGLESNQVVVEDEAMEQLIMGYTREAGVRLLEQKIAALCRYVAVQIVEHREKQRGSEESDDVHPVETDPVEGKLAELKTVENEERESRIISDTKETKVKSSLATLIPEANGSSIIDIHLLQKILGNSKFFSEARLRTGIPGVVTGLAYTQVGGELLFIESSMMEGSGKIQMTGKLGDVMKESTSLAYSYIRSHTLELEQLFKESGILGKMSGSPLRKEVFSTHDVHVHFPAGAIPKDGPSAGIAITMSLLSMLFDVQVPPSLAMTGEITLRGVVLPVGGIKEKILAAHRGKIHTIILSEQNKADVEELPEYIQKEMKFCYVRNINQAVRLIFSPERDLDGTCLTIPDHQSPVLQPAGSGTAESIVRAEGVDLAGPILQSHL